VPPIRSRESERKTDEPHSPLAVAVALVIGAPWRWAEWPTPTTSTHGSTLTATSAR